MDSSVGTPEVSIIVPVYNTEQYLDECLDSLCSQSLENIEIVCIDDGSHDASPLILDDRAKMDKRIRVIHQANAGVSRARNVGLEASRGRFILFVDSDDYIAAQTCEKLCLVANSNHADIVVFGGESFPSVDWIDRCFNVSNAVRKDPFQALFHEPGSYPLMCNKLYSRALIAENHMRFNEDLVLGEDNAFQFCIFPHARCVAFCQDRFYYYRCEREGSAINLLHSEVEKKVALHFEVVKYVVSQWAQYRIIEKHGSDLVSWLTDFLYDDVKDLSFDARLAFAQKFKTFCADNKLSVFMNDDNPFFEKCRFMSISEDEVLVEPVFSVVAIALPGASCMQKGFQAFSSQWESRIEILCIDWGENDTLTAELMTCIDSDNRARLIGSDEEAVVRAVREARAPYILFADLNDEYEPDTVSETLEHTSGIDADIITFRNTFHGLRTQSAERLLRSFEVSHRGISPEEPIRKWFSPEDYPARLFNFSSLSYKNKVFRRDYLLSGGLQGLGEDDIAFALLNACRIVPMEKYFVQIGPHYEKDNSLAEKAGAKLFDTLSNLRNRLIKEDMFSICERTFVNAVLASYFAYFDSLRTKESVLAFYPWFVRALNELIPLEKYDKSWFYDREDFEQTLAIRKNPADRYLRARNFERIDDLQQYVRFLEDVNYRQGKEISEFYGSISYKTGRAVTLLPRTAVALLKRIKHRCL